MADHSKRTFDVKVLFDDGASRSGSFDVETEGVAAPAPATLTLSVSSDIDDADALGQLVHALTVRIDQALASAVPTSDLDGDIQRCAASILGLPARQGLDPEGSLPPATGIQRKKYSVFVKDPLKSETLKQLRAYLALVGATLDRSDLGVFWGVTIAPGPKCTLRLNVGGAEVFNVRRTGVVRVYQQGATPNAAPSYAQSADDGVKTGGPNHYLDIPFADVAEGYRDDGVRDRAVARIEACWRGLGKNYHNPLAEQFDW